MRRERRSRAALEVRYAVAQRSVALHAAARDDAHARVAAEPESREAFEQLEDAEQLLHLAKWELRRARRALPRRKAFRAFFARWVPTPPPARARRR